MPPPPRNEADPIARADAWLRGCRRLLILTHRRPDGDAVGTALAAWHVLGDAGIACRVVLDTPIAPRYRPFIPDSLNAGPLAIGERFDGILCVDCARPDMLVLPAGWDLHALPAPICNLDHHVDNTRYGAVNLIDPECSAAAELLLHLFRTAGWTVSPTAATAMMLGLVMDTGGFRFTNTDVGCLDAAAWLMRQGARYDTVIDRVFFREPISRARLKARLVETTHFVLDNRLAYAWITDALLRECHAGPHDTEGLIDTLREIDGVQIACLLQADGKDIRVSFRSRSEAFPVIRIAQALGGGGHTLAAGATARGMRPDAVVRLICDQAREMLDG